MSFCECCGESFKGDAEYCNACEKLIEVENES